MQDQVAELVKHVEEEKAKQASAEVLRLERVWQKQAAAGVRRSEAASKQAEAERMRQAVEDQVKSLMYSRVSLKVFMLVGLVDNRALASACPMSEAWPLRGHSFCTRVTCLKDALT